METVTTETMIVPHLLLGRWMQTRRLAVFLGTGLLALAAALLLA
jgi:hypothetical protein